MLKTKWFGIPGVVLAGGVIAGCTTSSGFVNYDEREMYSGETAGNIEFLEIGPVSANTRGFVWASCDDMVTEVSDKLREEARQAGGNAIIHVRWRDFDSGMWERQPACTTAWGWAMVPPVVGVVWPWNKRVAAEGIAIYADDEQLESLRERIDERRAELIEEGVILHEEEQGAPDDADGEDLDEWRDEDDLDEEDFFLEDDEAADEDESADDDDLEDEQPDEDVEEQDDDEEEQDEEE
ncbi:hypothetical protein [Halorhodospira halochloris]|uniref:hypothetical protein n=1 Tax=Halorhodospira halochloris TaxID=1052 RepID=UPI001EE7B203|nr:hypothetical protein [Halorhodospira halochloris]MCG5547597.1 hypothetical protein [Halorhodospira halochloris]